MKKVVLFLIFNIVSYGQNKIELKLIDINGRVVLDELIGSSVYTLNRSMFVSGFYVCEIITNEGSVYYRKVFLQ